MKIEDARKGCIWLAKQGINKKEICTASDIAIVIPSLGKSKTKGASALCHVGPGVFLVVLTKGNTLAAIRCFGIPNEALNFLVKCRKYLDEVNSEKGEFWA